MAVLDRAKAGTYAVYLSSSEAATIIDMLAEPKVTDELRGVVMPEEPSEELMDAMWTAWVASSKGAHPPITLRAMYRSIYTSLREHAAKAARKRTEWVVSGRVAPGGVVAYYATARTEAERDDHVAAALKNGCHPVTIDRREVAG